MCGIAGKLSWLSPLDSTILQLMADEMKLRGPDAQGIYRDGPIGLAHRRLSIIDLSEAGRQPLYDSSKNFVIIFNGEIYNYQNIRQELEKLGCNFQTKTDTEVIVEAYKNWGADCLMRLNGMFALAIWNKSKQELFLARDRLGKKPLYYYIATDGSLTFASELKALLHDSAIKKQINFSALSSFLSLSYIPTEQCIIDGVKKLPAAHFILVNRSSFKIERYWDVKEYFYRKQKISEQDAVENLRALLADATRLRMISDVPLGAFLSGGLDSSSIVASMSRLVPRDKVKTFSIGFREKSYSEVEEAREVAHLLGVSHHDQTVEAEMSKILADIVYAADEPFADNSMIPCYYLSAFARKHVTVALSGDGGDEIFAGYETYTADKLHQLFSFVPHFFARSLHGLIDRILPITFDKVSWEFKLRRFMNGLAYPFDYAHYSWRLIFSEIEKRKLIKESFRSRVCDFSPFTIFEKKFAEVEDLHPLDQAMYVDINTWLVDDILVKADRMSMAHSLELRCPLLDHRIVEFAASLPIELKMKNFTKKYILKKSQQGLLSDDILGRKKKGFNAPVAHWLNKNLANMLKELMANSKTFQEIVSETEVEKLISQHQKQKQDNSLLLFNQLVLGLWLQNIDQ